MVEVLKNIKLADIVPGKFNPRKEFEKDALKELADSIKAQGLVQPLVVRPKGKKHELVVGERRYRAANMVKKDLQFQKVPCIVKDLSDQEVMEMQLTENLLREDLNAIEEAEAVKALRDVAGMKEIEIAEKLGKSQPWVSDRIRILGLPKKLQEYIPQGILGPSHAEALLKLKKEKDILAVAKDLERMEWEGGERKKVFRPTVIETEEAVEDYLEALKEQEAFEKALKKSEVKKCPVPECGKKAVRLSTRFGKKTVLTCSEAYHLSGHNWDPKTGELVKTDHEIREEQYQKQRAKEATEKRAIAKKSGKKTPVHVPTMPAWFFSKATKQQWAKALLKHVQDDIDYMEWEYGNIGMVTGTSLVDDAVTIRPVNAPGFKTMVRLGGYRSTPSKSDNVARGESLVSRAKKSIGKLLKFQNDQVHVKQTMKEIMVKKVGDIELGAKVKVSKDHITKSYRGAGAQVIGFTMDGNAVLNYSKPDKLIPTTNLEVVTSSSKKGSSNSKPKSGSSPRKSIA